MIRKLPLWIVEGTGDGYETPTVECGRDMGWLWNSSCGLLKGQGMVMKTPTGTGDG